MLLAFWCNRQFQHCASPGGNVGAFGEKLRRERETRGIRLEEIADATKISTRSLKALEDENFSILPGGIFDKGFVRAYARYLGINEDQAVDEYTSAVGTQPPSMKSIAHEHMIQRAKQLAAEQAMHPVRNNGPLVQWLVLIAAIAGFTWGGMVLYRSNIVRGMLHRGSHSTQPASVQAAAGEPSAPVTATPVGTEPTAPSGKPAIIPASLVTASKPTATEPAQPAEFVLAITTAEPCWLSVVADGKQSLRRTMAPNEQQTVSAHEKIRLTIGNPASLELSLNGRPLLIPGELTHPRTVIVDADGIQSE